MGAATSMTILAKTRIGKGYRITISREVRRFLELTEGDEIEWIFNGSKIIIRKSSIGDTRG